MKKFSSIDSKKLENKKYKDTLKNDMYNIIKESTLGSNDYIEGDVDFEIKKIVEKIDKLIYTKSLNEKASVLKGIKNNISTGTLNVGMINEAIEACECSEVCDIPGTTEYETEVEVEDEFINDFDETEDENTEFVTTNESKILNESVSIQDDIDLADEFIKLVDEGKATNMTWDSFFDMYGVSENDRTNSIVESIMKQVQEKRPEIF